MAKLPGGDKALRRLKSLNSRSAVKRVGAAVYAAADIIRVEAALSISEGAVSGKGHVPSSPGQPPNYDSGTLADSIEVREVGELECDVVASAPYALALEFGTSKMSERPFMRPAAAKGRPVAERLVARALKDEFRSK
ncbi:MAG: HK97 gp10 family phage protein [Novosphingobium sp.]